MGRCEGVPRPQSTVQYPIRFDHAPRRSGTAAPSDGVLPDPVVAVTRRRPVQRRTRRPSRQQQQRDAQLLVFAAVTAAGIGLAVMVVNWLRLTGGSSSPSWPSPSSRDRLALPPAAAGPVGGGAGAGPALRTAAARRAASPPLRGRHTRPDATRRLPGRPADRRPWRPGADVKATNPYGRRWVIQCKHRRNGAHGSPVGTLDLQVLNGTARQVHGTYVAVIVTHKRVTGPAVAFARQQRLHVVDRQTLAVWASGSRPLWELLRAVPPPGGEDFGSRSVLAPTQPIRVAYRSGNRVRISRVRI
jgi:restriction system protein